MKGTVAGISFALVLGGSGIMLSAVPQGISYTRPAVFELEEQKTATLLFGGDMLFDRSIRLAMEREGEEYVLSCIADLLRSADMVVANLEGPITSHPSKSVHSKVYQPENFTFTFPTSTAALLERHNIGLVNIGNNHILNFGADGYNETLRWLDAAGVQYFGDPGGGLPYSVARTEVNGIPLSFVNWNDWGSLSLEETLALITIESRTHTVVVYTHWGDEYVPATGRMKTLARRFVEAGADAVIGSHPHVVQEKELYLGKHIYYSLGNMLFDQYWEEEVRRGLLLEVEFNPRGIERVVEIPIDNQIDRRTCAA